MSRQSLLSLGILIFFLSTLPGSLKADSHKRRWERWGQFEQERQIDLPSDLTEIRVDASPNGGIDVEGWDRSEIELVARVFVNTDHEEDAEKIAAEIEIETDRVIRARGPRMRYDDEGWWVSFYLRVPRKMDLDLETYNGGIQITDVQGKIRFDALNGGIKLQGVGGDVAGQTTNGGVEVELMGTRWEGRALDVETTNGGIELLIPEDFNARVETGTVNGRLRTDFPVTVQGEIDRDLRLTLGDGGPLVRATTVNGSARIRRR